MLGDQDTIAAIATAKGVGALSIVRISGPKTSSLLSSCFKPNQSSNTKMESHHGYFGYWCHPQNGEKLDQVITLFYSEGKGFTGEEAAEIICHGGIEVTDLVLKSTLLAGARLARPGEFTYRAVLNNKIELTQAESVLELIHARSPQAAALALKNIEGALSTRLLALEKQTLFLLAHLEASIDFTTEDIQPVDYKEMGARLELVLSEIQKLLKTFLPTRIASRGVRVALVGRPNAGKSSLLNALLGSARSIVDQKPGTTRDTIESEIKIDGALFKLIDTAGLRVTEDNIEKQGVDRTLLEINSADIVLYIVDGSLGLTNEDAENIKNTDLNRTLLCFNKNDLKKIDTENELRRFGLLGLKTISSSALKNSGVEQLATKLSNLGVIHRVSGEVDGVISTERQNECLKHSFNVLSEARDLLSQNASPDLVSFSIREGLLEIQKALGKDFNDDIMDKVFKEFCIGK